MDFTQVHIPILIVFNSDILLPRISLYQFLQPINLIFCDVSEMSLLHRQIINNFRFGERIFWSIEAVRSSDEVFIMQAKTIVDAARSIELYVFLQSYLHALPQVLFQLYILMRHNHEINRETGNYHKNSFIYAFT